MCDVLGWKPVGFYIDNDRSADRGKDREEWDRLLDDIKTNKIDAIVVWNQDRGWRMMSEFEALRPQLEPLGVLLATTNIGVINFGNPDDIFRAQVSTAMSEMELAKMRVRQLRAAKQRAEQGRPKWRKAFGYLDMGGDLREPDPETAPLVKQAYAALLAGSSLNDIARLFNKAGAYGLTGKPWTASTVSLFLRAPRNAGLRYYHGEEMGEATWPGLVDPSTWKAVQAVLSAPGRAPGRKTVRRHLLTGVLQCGNPTPKGGGGPCEGYLSGQWVRQPTGGKPGRPKAGEVKQQSGLTAYSIAYACKTCRGVSIRAEHVEPLLYEVVSGRLAMPDAVDLLKAEIHDEAETEALRAETNVLTARLNEIADERADGLLDGPQAKRATDRIKEKLAVIERRQQDQERLRVLDGLPLGEPEVAQAVAKLSPERFRAVVDLLMTVTVQPVGKGGRTVNSKRVQVDPKGVAAPA